MVSWLEGWDRNGGKVEDGDELEMYSMGADKAVFM